MDTRRYENIKNFLRTELFIGVPPSADMGDKIALVTMICHLTYALKQKKPCITHYETIRLCTKNIAVEDNQIERLALVCEWFSFDCIKFPDLGVAVKDMPAKIAEQIKSLLPF